MKDYGKGRYVELRTNERGDLEMIPTSQALADADHFLELPTMDALYEILEDWLCNGWEFVLPENIGALTDAPILTDEIIYGDLGTVEYIGNVWWFTNYAIENEVETLLKKGKVVFSLAKEEK